MMNNSFKLGLLGACLAVGTLHSVAGTVFTNVTTRAVTFTLTAQAQVGANASARVSIADKDLLQLLKFPATAKLLLLDGGGAIARLVTKSNTIDYAISSTNLAGFQGSTLVTNATSQYSIDEAVISINTTVGRLAADLEGFTTKTLATKAWSSIVIGTGTLGTSPAVLQGTILAGAECLHEVRREQVQVRRVFLAATEVPANNPGKTGPSRACLFFDTALELRRCSGYILGEKCSGNR